MKYNKTILLLCSFFLFLNADEQEASEVTPLCHIPGMGGKVPERVCEICKNIKITADFNSEKPKWNSSEVLVFDGKDGVGRSFAVEMIAQEAHAKLMVYDLTELRKKYGKNLFSTLDKIYEEAEARVLYEKRPVILLFKNAGRESRSEWRLNKYIDRNAFANRHESFLEHVRSYIHTIVTTNDVKKFGPGPKDRYRPVFFALPDREDREEIISVCAEKHCIYVPSYLTKSAALLSPGITPKEIEDGFYFLVKKSRFEDLTLFEKTRLFLKLIKYGKVTKGTVITGGFVALCYVLFKLQQSQVSLSGLVVPISHALYV